MLHLRLLFRYTLHVLCYTFYSAFVMTSCTSSLASNAPTNLSSFSRFASSSATVVVALHPLIPSSVEEGWPEAGVVLFLFSNAHAAAPGLARFPLCSEKINFNSLDARLRLSVRTSTSIATPP